MILDSEIKRKRKEALTIGDDFYFSGKECKNGHIAMRETVSGACIECKKLYVKRDRAIFKKAKELGIKA